MYDVIVVGAGPAGSGAAYHCAKKGFKVLLLEKKEKIGVPKQCGEGINQAILEELNLRLKPEWISRKVDSLVVSNFNNFLKLKGRRTRGLILDRKKFDPGLAERAEKEGAELRRSSAVTELTKEGVMCNKKEIKGRVIIGADGPNTVVGEKSGLGRPKGGLGLQYEIKTKKTSFPDSLQCYLDRNLEEEGYLWVFPKKETLNVGVGSMKIKNLKPALDCFIKRLGLEKEKIQEINAGLIPLHGPLEKFCNERILLIGDAAGHTNPFSGGGMPAALFDGVLASEIIRGYFEEKIPLTTYQKAWWESDLGKATLISLKAKKLFLKFLKEDKFNVFLNKTGNREITKVKDLFFLTFKLPFPNSLRLLRMFWSFMKAYKYAW